jgi:hypothetical protein
MVGIMQLIDSSIKPKDVIPKPQAKGNFIVKGWGIRRGERALIYTIPNRKDQEKPYQKGITISEWALAYDRLRSSGDFSREWFNQFMPQCAKEGGCNFTTIGGVFELLGLAHYSRGIYARNSKS